jgi:hypothetical protein
MPDLSAYAWPVVDDPWDEIAAALDHARIGDGARLIASLANAMQTPPAKCSDPFEFPRLFEGRRLRLRIAHSSRDGMKALVIRKIIPPGN